jgi:hypothetical protein
MKFKLLNNNDGIILPVVLVFGAICIIILGGIIDWGMINLRAAEQTEKREVAFEIAESGDEYYRWHLAHSPTDYQDGTAASGPYVHQFHDKSGNKIGSFSLTITPPLIGSTIVTIQSNGISLGDYHGYRTIQTQLAKPSMAKYSVVANDNLRFGAGTTVNGPIQSNKGIQFDGVANNLVSSAVSTFYDADSDIKATEFGVFTHSGADDPLPPAAVPNRPDVFNTGREFPVPAVDFTGLAADLSQIETDAKSKGLYFSNSGALGYDIVLKTNDTFDLYRVNTLRAVPNSGCQNTLSQTGWGTWSIDTGGGAKTFLNNYAFPANGLIFLEDNVFVEGQINVARLTIAAATFPSNPSTWKSITVNNNLFYTNFDGRDVISLVAQNNINVGLFSQDTLTIDAALIAENGRVGRYYYPSGSTNCGSDAIKTTLNLDGMIATNVRYGFGYTDNTGYLNRNIAYDHNLLLSPPPSFPQTSDQYTIMSWKEIQ